VAQEYDPALKDLLAILAQGTDLMKKAIAFIKENGNDYMDLYGRPLVDIAIALINGYLFCDQASTRIDMEVALPSDNGQPRDDKTVSMKQRKAVMARRYIVRNAPRIEALVHEICQGDKSTFEHYETLIGPVQTD
jgi:hypothetical protein